MRTYGRINGQWQEVTETTSVWLTTLAQVLKLEQGESPFYANYGLPAQQSVLTQIVPDAAVARTQSQFSPYFASLTIQSVGDSTVPEYNIFATRPDGALINAPVAT